MDAAVGEDVHDWEEVEAGSDIELVSSPVSVDGSMCSEESEVDSTGLIRLDYFSIGEQVTDYASGEGFGVEADSPSWLDPRIDTSRFLQRDGDRFWSDTGSDASDDGKAGEFGYDVEGIVVNNVTVEFSDDNVTYVAEKTEDDVGETSKECFTRDRHDSLGKSVDLEQFRSHASGDSVFDNDVIEEDENLVEIEGTATSNLTNPSEGRKGVLWWKVPFEMIKHYLLRVSPLWSLSMAAAVFGFVILGKKLYKMKRKAQSLQVKVICDDKKVSQALSRAAKLNESFSVAKRVPIIRPSLPQGGMNQYPLVTLR